MTSLFHFEDKVHCRNLTRVESTPLLFPRLLCQVLEHIGFTVEPRLECRRDCEAILTVDRWQTKPRSFHLPPPKLAEEQPAIDLPQRSSHLQQFILRSLRFQHPHFQLQLPLLHYPRLMHPLHLQSPRPLIRATVGVPETTKFIF